MEDVSNIKELFFQNCMAQIRVGLKDINDKNQQLLRASQFDYGGNVAQSMSAPANQDELLEIVQQLHPDLVNSASIDESKNRIAKSINLMSQFIDEFEGLRSRQGAQGKAGTAIDKEVAISVNNQISNSQGPSKINLQLPQSTKIGELKE